MAVQQFLLAVIIHYKDGKGKVNPNNDDVAGDKSLQRQRFNICKGDKCNSNMPYRTFAYGYYTGRPLYNFGAPEDQCT